MSSILYHKSYYGFGDNLYERPFLIARAGRFDEVYVETHFPQIYWDQPGWKFLKPVEKLALHLQNENAAQFKHYARKPPNVEKVMFSTFRFNRKHTNASMVEFFASVEPEGMKHFNFRPMEEWVISARRWMERWRKDAGTRPICLLKRPAIHDPVFPWQPESRIPLGEHFQEIVNWLKSTHYIISYAQTSENGEQVCFDLDGIDQELHHGELDIWTLCALVRMVDINIGYPSFIVPLCLSARARSYMIYGCYEPPSYHFPERLAIQQRMGFIAPSLSYEPLSQWATIDQKRIPDLMNDFKAWEYYSGEDVEHDAR